MNRQIPAISSPLRHKRIAATACKYPHLPAVVDRAGTVKYSELESRANHLAQVLRIKGVAIDTPVGVCLARSSALIVALMAVLRAGGGYVPVDPELPLARIEFVFRDAKVNLVLCDGESASRVPSGIATVRVDELRRDGLDCELIDSSAEDRLAYVLHTSGSTGRPKGVAVTEHAVTNLLDSLAPYLRCEPGDRVLFTSSILFDVSTVEIFLPLLKGACIVVADRNQARDGGEIADLIDRFAVSIAAATPSAWRATLSALEKGGRRERLQIISAGEALSVDLARRLLAIADTVVNGYGPTETTIYATMSCVEARSDGTIDASIGRPLAGAEVEIISEDGCAVRDGDIGEILVKGKGVARGYLGLPDATAERFIRRQGDHGMCYRTGDLGRRRSDGAIEYIGRRDDQIKIRGQRVEPAEVEGRLLAHERVQAAAVRPWTNGSDTRLVAYVVAQNVASAELRAWCAETLPDALVPSIIVPIETVPLTESGKIDVRKLPEPTLGAAVESSAQRTDIDSCEGIEERIRAVWAQALWVDTVGLSEDFFALGGDSLTAMTVLERLEEIFGIRLPLRTIFGQPTVRGLAEAVLEARSPVQTRGVS